MKSEKEEARRVDRLIVALDLVKINEWSNYYFFFFLLLYTLLLFCIKYLWYINQYC